MPLDASILLQGRGIQLPDPIALATQGVTLADLANRGQLQQYALKQAQRKDMATQALGQLLPQLQQAGFSDESVQGALQHPLVQQNPDVASAILETVDARRKSESASRKDAAIAFKDTAEGKVKLLQPLTNQAYSLANKPDLSPADVAAFSKIIAANGLQDMVRNIPFQDWSNPEAARKNLKTIGSAFFEAEKQVSTAETAFHNRTTEQQQGANYASEAEARKANTAQGWARINSESMGAPQEVTVNGVPALASFNRKGGGWFDPATGKPISGGVAPKSPEMSSTMREKFAANNTLLSKIDDGIANALERPQSFGAKFFGPDALNQRTDPQGVDARASIASIGSQKFHDLSGAAITISEAPRLQPFIPSVSDTPQAIKAKLNRLRKETETLQRELMAGRPTMDAIRAPASTASAAPGIRSITPLD